MLPGAKSSGYFLAYKEISCKFFLQITAIKCKLFLSVVGINRKRLREKEKCIIIVNVEQEKTVVICIKRKRVVPKRGAHE